MLQAISAAALLLAGTVLFQDKKQETPQAGPEHEILRQFAGDWECDVDLYLEPGKPPTKSTSTMTARMIGPYWAVIVIKGDALGMPFEGQATFGYDSQKKKYMGTWVDSMFNYMWKYDGKLDGNKLIMDSEGPNPAEPGKMVKARDTWEIKGKDEVVLTGEMEGPDGKMMLMTRATCKRKGK